MRQSCDGLIRPPPAPARCSDALLADLARKAEAQT